MFGKRLSPLLTAKASALTLMMTMAAGGILIAAPPPLAMAQQQQEAITETPTPTTEPLTPEEQHEQNRLQNTTAAITRNLAQGQKEINGVVYTPRWSSPVWVEPESLSILFVYCLPGEFADSGQDTLGGSELEVLESYSLAVTNDTTGWLMVVENEDENVRFLAAVGVICASDANNPESRILSPDEETEINNIIKQFITIRTTQITNITQVINIINNVTTNGTGCQLEIATNEETYTSGQLVTMTVTNDGNEALDFPNSVLGLEIENVDTDEMYPIISLQVITTLEPGESRTFEFTYEELVSEIGTGTIEARVGSDGCSASTTFTLTNEITEPLTASISVDSTNGNTAPATFLFESNEQGGTSPYAYSWDFGDGQQSTGPSNQHTYQQAGTYTVTLNVTDSTGQTASDSRQVSVQPAAPTTGEPTTNETEEQ
jgi:hypothetical protein